MSVKLYTFIAVRKGFSMNVASKLKELQQHLDNMADSKELTTYEVCYMGNSYNLYNLGVEIDNDCVLLTDESGVLINNIDKIPNAIPTTLIENIFISVETIDIILTNKKYITIKILD